VHNFSLCRPGVRPIALELANNPEIHYHLHPFRAFILTIPASDPLSDMQRGMKMRTYLFAILVSGAIGGVGTSNTAAAPANGAAIVTGAQAISLVQDAVTIVTTVYKCKINGRWRPGRCPDNTLRRVDCVGYHTEKFRHLGHCRTPG
jgi:hypothetical protein